MKNIFVFTASDANAKKHIQDTVGNSIPKEKVEKHFKGDKLAEVKEIGKKNEYFAWGALPGERNIQNWNNMQIRDHVLVYQYKAYTYYSMVLFKARNANFALDNWGKSREDETREYMYLLEKPLKLDPPVRASDLADYLPSSYRGFMRLSDNRTKKIMDDFGSIDRYFNDVLPNVRLELPEGVTFWWVNQGKSYAKEVGQIFLWAPKKGKDGSKPRHWKNIESVRKDDIVFNYANGALRAISIAKGNSYDFHNEKSKDWNKDGVRVDIEHFPIDPIEIRKIRPHKDTLQKALIEKNGPFNKEGNIKQGYLFEFNLEAAKLIRDIYGQSFPEAIERYFVQEKKHEDWIIDLLQKKGQIIIYGPPGTGKTFSTKKISLMLIEYD